MASDQDPTARFYAENAEAYANYAVAPNAGRLETFLAHLEPDEEILELGCGNGRDSAFMIERGYRVTPTDGVEEMTRQAAARLGVPVSVLRFEDIAAANAFDGIWANACLLHVPRPALADVLARIHRALRPGGIFYASFKSGGDAGEDRLGRYYNNPTRMSLAQIYEGLPWSSLQISENSGTGYDDVVTGWLHVTAVKP